MREAAIDTSSGISVIIPARNEEAYLGQCIQSMLKQTVPPLEIIVVDNGSSDKTAEVARRFPVRLFDEPRIGLPRARETGRRMAHGEILVFIDADVIVPPTYIATIAHYFQAHPNIAALSNPFRFYDGKRIQRIAVSIFFRFIEPVHQAILRLCGLPTALFGGSFAVRCDVLERSGGFDLRTTFYGEDVLTTKRVAKHGKITFLRNLYTETSARRYVREGNIRAALVYSKHYFAILLFGRVLTHSIRKRVWRFTLAGCALVFLLYAVAYPSAEVFGRVIYRLPVSKTDKVVALTFDDGPNGSSTEEVLHILQSNGVPATFFLVGDNVEAYPDVARDIVRSGYAIGNHSDTHRWLLPIETNHFIEQDVSRGEDAIAAATGVRPALFRPPHGFRSPWMLGSLHEEGYRVITWNDMTTDYSAHTSTKRIVSRILKRVRPGSIIVMHDGLNLTHNANRNYTLEALRIIIPELKARGYSFVTLNQYYPNQL